MALLDQSPPHHPVDREHQYHARDADHEEEAQEIDLHHLLLTEDRTEHGEQHVRCDASRERGHRLQPGGTGVDGGRQRARGVPEEASDQGREAEGSRQDEVEGESRPKIR